MMRVVIDASIAISWLLRDEHEVRSIRLQHEAAGDPSARLLVPPIFWSEIINVLAVAVRRSRINPDAARQAPNALAAFGLLEYDVSLDAAFEIAIHDAISAYDAQYLTLARSESASLWTLDKRLTEVGKTYGLDVQPSL